MRQEDLSLELGARYEGAHGHVRVVVELTEDSVRWESAGLYQSSYSGSWCYKRIFATWAKRKLPAEEEMATTEPSPRRRARKQSPASRRRHAESHAQTGDTTEEVRRLREELDAAHRLLEEHRKTTEETFLMPLQAHLEGRLRMQNIFDPFAEVQPALEMSRLLQRSGLVDSLELERRDLLGTVASLKARLHDARAARIQLAELRDWINLQAARSQIVSVLRVRQQSLADAQRLTDECLTRRVYHTLTNILVVVQAFGQELPESTRCPRCAHLFAGLALQAQCAMDDVLRLLGRTPEKSEAPGSPLV